jgi:hypothetical protein
VCTERELVSASRRRFLDGELPGCTPNLARNQAAGYYEGNTHMKKLMIALVLAFAVLGGAVAVSVVTGTPAVADGCASC